MTGPRWLLLCVLSLVLALAGGWLLVHSRAEARWPDFGRDGPALAGAPERMPPSALPGPSEPSALDPAARERQAEAWREALRSLDDPTARGGDWQRTLSETDPEANRAAAYIAELERRRRIARDKDTDSRSVRERRYLRDLERRRRIARDKDPGVSPDPAPQFRAD